MYATEPSGLRVIPTLLGMRGFWRDEFPDAVDRLPPVALLMAPLLLLAVAGAAPGRRLGRPYPP